MTLADQIRIAVRDALDAAGVTQAEAAGHVGVSAQHMNRILTGAATLSPYRAEKIARLCGRELVVTSRKALAALEALAQATEETNDEH